MKIKQAFIYLVLFSLVACSENKVKSSADYPEWDYTQLKRELVKCWNTWDTRSVFTEVWSEDKLGVKVSLVDSEGAENDRIRIGNREEDAAVVHPYDHAYDGSYVEADASWHDISVKMRCAAEGKRLVMLFTPVGTGNKGDLKVSPGLLWAGVRIEGGWKVTEDHFELISMFGTGVMTGKVLSKNTRFVQTKPNEGYYLCPSDEPVLIYVGEEITPEEASTLMETRKKAFVDSCRTEWGEDYDVHHAMQSILAWDTIYDPVDGVVVTPVSRNWNQGWCARTFDQLGGYILFDWDTYFASEMFSVDNRELAYCNAIEITMAADKCGFVPNFTTSNSCSVDRSQPPVGSRAVWTIYERYHDRWFLELLYPRLLRWNLWWPANRDQEGLLCWGSTPAGGAFHTDEPTARQQAIYESGLDNTWVYDDSRFLLDKNVVCYNDVGLSAMYVMDCEFLAKIADELGCRKDAREIRQRGEYYKKNLQSLWSDEDGMFFCKDLRDGQLVKKMDATNFYPMLCGAASPEQAWRMVKEHLTNDNEFWGEWIVPVTPRNSPALKDNNYWRGRIWGPTNFLVYLGLREYGFEDVRKEFAQKSNKLLMKDWLARGYIYENWNAVTGQGDDVNNSDRFYHWGSLLGYINLMEK
ncbi:MAG: hypothetical protein J6N54_10115 [Bacteroidales bacterium]|nr:hypothetical protein [Bacteroidales bacterium]